MSNTPNQNNEIKKHWTLYVLRLVQDKYYVGITTKTPEERMEEHRQRIMGAAWTQRYKPLEIIERQDLGLLSEADARAIETNRTGELMGKYGHNNVRGGDLTYRGNYAKWFSWLIEDKDVDAVYSVLALLGIILLLAVLYILKK